jgi:hypothetical protein
MSTCATCKHWKDSKNRYNNQILPQENPATMEEWKSQEEEDLWFPYKVKYCLHPKVLFYQRPAKDGLAVFDGSEYCAYIATGEDFGCNNHE